MCMCGDSMCGSCHPGAAEAEARFDACYEALRKFIDVPWQMNVDRKVGDANNRKPFGPTIGVSGPSVATLIECIFDDGNEDGLTRLAAFIIARENVAIERARAEDAAAKAELLAYEQEVIAQAGYESLRDSAVDRQSWLDFVNAASDEPQEFYED